MFARSVKTFSLATISILLASFFAATAPGSSTAEASSHCPGGSEITVSGVKYCLLEFTNPGSTTWTVPQGIKFADVLVVGGGGAGSFSGGGAGGGGVVHVTNYSLEGVTQPINVVVGAGGTVPDNKPPTSGGNSSFRVGGVNGLVAFGGGTGGSGNGGSGGGANNAAGQTAGTSTQTVQAGIQPLLIGGQAPSGNVYGNAGGAGEETTDETPGCSAGGGGGGAGQPGAPASGSASGTDCAFTSGKGGDGISINITGTAGTYGAGGGGSGAVFPSGSGTVTGGAGGVGGGGAGNSTGPGGSGSGIGSGGGGGGFQSPATAFAGGNGSAGAVIVRYQIPETPSVTNPANASIDAGDSVTLFASVTRPASGATSFVWQQLIGGTWTDIDGSSGTHTGAAGSTQSAQLARTLSGPASGNQYRLKAVNTTPSGNEAVTFSSAATITVDRRNPGLDWTLPETQASVVLADSGLTLVEASAAGEGSFEYEDGFTYSVTDAGDAECAVVGRILTFSLPGTCTVEVRSLLTDIFQVASVVRTITVGAGEFAIGRPGAQVTASTSAFFDVCGEACEITGFAPADEIDVVIDGGGATVRLGDLTDIENDIAALANFPDTDWADGADEIGFRATQAIANLALATLQVRRAASGSTTLAITAQVDGNAVKVADTSFVISPPPPPPPASPGNRPRPEVTVVTVDGPLGIGVRPPGVVRPSTVLGQGDVSSALSSPFRAPGGTFTPGDGHRAFTNGQPSAIIAAQLGDSAVSFGAGNLQMTLGLGSGSAGGGVGSFGPGGNPTLRAPLGSGTDISGSGLMPGSSVSLWLPIDGRSPINLGQIFADSAGRFSGSVSLQSDDPTRPLPIGPQFLQVSGVDSDGNAVVVDVVILISQGPPSPAVILETGDLPTQGVNGLLGMSNGVPIDVTRELDPSGAITFSDGDWSFTVSSSAANDAAEAPPASGDITVSLQDSLLVSGLGFLGATRSDVWLFSTPSLLGSFDVDEYGAFAGAVGFSDSSIEPGTHTLQIQAVGQDGLIKTVNLGIVVIGEPEPGGISFLPIAAVLGGLLLLGVVFWVLVLARRARQQADA
jgi:hypothetical protein